MLSDFHVHTSFSGDSQTPARDQIEAAIRLGMKEICITDHHDYGTTQMCKTDFTLDLDSYFPALRELAEEYQGKIRVLSGIELGLMLREQEYLVALEKTLPVDYIIGSNHFIDGYDVYDRNFYIDNGYCEGGSDRNAYLRFFESSLARVRTFDCFDSLGHLDYVIRYGPTKNHNYRPADYMEVIDEILHVLIQKGKALECNTAGFKYGLGHPHPYEEILKRYHEIGGELLTVGSDGHRPHEVGGLFDQAAEILKTCGFRYYTVYHDRKPEFVSL